MDHVLSQIKSVGTPITPFILYLSIFQVVLFFLSFPFCLPLTVLYFISHPLCFCLFLSFVHYRLPALRVHHFPSTLDDPLLQ